MKGHVAAEALIDLAEGGGEQEARAHVAICESCREQTDVLRRELATLGEVGVPEPPGMYWEAFRRQVGQRLQGEARGLGWRQWLAPVAAAAVVMIGLTLRTPQASDAPQLTAVTTLPAWSALPAVDEDAGLVVLQALADDGQLSGGSSCDEVAACVESLSEDDAATFVSALRGELGGRQL
jgi:hypothetical protein